MQVAMIHAVVGFVGFVVSVMMISGFVMRIPQSPEPRCHFKMFGAMVVSMTIFFFLMLYGVVSLVPFI